MAMPAHLLFKIIIQKVENKLIDAIATVIGAAAPEGSSGCPFIQIAQNAIGPPRARMVYRRILTKWSLSSLALKPQ